MELSVERDKKKRKKIASFLAWIIKVTHATVSFSLSLRFSGKKAKLRFSQRHYSLLINIQRLRKEIFHISYIHISIDSRHNPLFMYNGILSLVQYLTLASSIFLRNVIKCTYVSFVSLFACFKYTNVR